LSAIHLPKTYKKGAYITVKGVTQPIFMPDTSKSYRAGSYFKENLN